MKNNLPHNWTNLQSTKEVLRPCVEVLMPQLFFLSRHLPVAEVILTPGTMAGLSLYKLKGVH